MELGELTFLEEWCTSINEIIQRHENDEYLTKKHLIDALDKKFDEIIKRFKLNIER